jgi:hypothetical protein
MISVRAFFSGAAHRNRSKDCGSLLEWCSAFKRSVAVWSSIRLRFATFFLGAALCSSGAVALTLVQAEQELLAANSVLPALYLWVNESGAHDEQ